MPFRKLDLFPSSGEGRQTSALLDLIERANLNYWTIKFRKQDLFPSSGEGRQTSALLGLIERANLTHWTTTFRELDLFRSSGEGSHLLCWIPWQELFSLTGPQRFGNRIYFHLQVNHWKTRRHAVSETLCFLVFSIPDDEQSP
jgi:hypothetical protein